MLLALKKLFTGEATCVPFDYMLDLDDPQVEGPVHVTGQAVSQPEGVSLLVTADFTHSVSCDRCAKLVKSGKQYHFNHELVQELHSEDNESMFWWKSRNWIWTSWFGLIFCWSFPQRICANRTVKGFARSAAQI